MDQKTKLKHLQAESRKQIIKLISIKFTGMLKISTFVFATALTLASMPSTTFGQTDKEELSKTFEAYFKTVELKDNEKTLDYIYPKLFDHFPKERMLQSMNNAKNDTTTLITVNNALLGSISESIELNKVKYAVLQYTFRMTMVFITPAEVDEAEKDDEDEDENPAEFAYEMLKEKYGESNVSLAPETNTLTVNVSNEMYGINDPAYAGWKFLDKKESMKPILEKIIPKKILKAL